ncbi:GNAT family N-acetyltransferase [Solicola sp. PLA-1-18]|uniref:GNAT family N-acetyltransferase n=1 Tax=Solicola sp. PLA-1-18 TaxID=3380532 RepID=UPI003B80997F
MRWQDEVPVLTDGVVTLRAHTEDDVDPMTQMCQDGQMVRWTSVPHPYTRADAQRYVRDFLPEGWQRQHRGWAVEALDDDGEPRYAGNLDVRGLPVADVGFALHPWARGRGVMHRAVSLATQWAFMDGGVEIVHWRAHVGNVDSLRVAWRAGFSLDGTTPGLLHERGRLLDAWTGHLSFGDRPEPRTTWWDTPVVDGERGRLRPFREDDLERVVEATRDDETHRFLQVVGLPRDLAAARRWLDRNAWGSATGRSVHWCVADPASDAFLATVAVTNVGEVEPLTGELAYWAHPDARGRGVVGEAARLALAHATAPDGMGLRRVELLAAASNPGSNAIARRLGFVHVGTERAAEPLADGSFDDLVRYDLLA